MYGELTINGQTYIERNITLFQDVTVTAASEVIRNRRVQLPGTAPFVCKGLVRVTLTAAGVDITATQRFRFRYGNNDGNIWYVVPGVGGTNDRAIDLLMFGPNRAFPGLTLPFNYFTPNSVIPFEVEDINGAANVPYTIQLGFIGSYLFPKGR